jgi:DNA-binding response OmpR family regulator
LLAGMSTERHGVTTRNGSDNPRADRPLVLVVDDEPTLRETIAYNLRREGWAVAQAGDGDTALALARRLRPDAIVLDVMLPGLDGLQVCRALRVESTVPILFLSARGEAVDRILGLELGGDDYLTKPFAMRELVARVRAMLRRAQMVPDAAVAGVERRAAVPVDQTRRGADFEAGAVLTAGDLRLDLARRSVRLRGEPLALKPKEFDLLAYLMRHPGIVLSREALLREVWGYDFPIDTRTVDVHIRWLRQKLEVDPARPQRIETVRGYGYRFAGDSG